MSPAFLCLSQRGTYKHGDYGDEGLSMSNLIEDQYGDLAHSFILSLVSYDPEL